MDAVTEKQVPEGIFYKAIYSNEKYGTSIALYKAKDDSIFTVTGVMLPTVKNVCYHFNGEWVNNQKYGIQFKASDYSEIVNSDRDSIISYLSSGIIKGIGKVTAARIYDRFGERTMEVFDTDIESLRGIRGITEKKLIKINLILMYMLINMHILGMVERYKLVKSLKKVSCIKVKIWINLNYLKLF